MTELPDLDDPAPECAAEGCDKPRRTKGYCVKHYMRLLRHGNLVGKNPLGRSVEDRFWSHVVKQTGDGCWEWQGAKHKPFGYGMFGVTPKRIIGAHRFAYQLHFGAIPDGMVICHHCDNPPCVRPDHLFLGTQADNVRDMISKGRFNNRGRRTHCPKGHPYDEENTAIRRDGAQACRKCRKIWAETSRRRAAERRNREQASA